MPDLRELEKHREALLLAEVAAWLHDIGKAGLKKENLPENWRQFTETRDVSSIHPEQDPSRFWLLAQCHGIGHLEKKEPDPQIKTNFISTPLGFDNTKRTEWQSNDEEVQKWLLDIENKTYARDILRSVTADSRYPINEITLWSWAEIVGAFYKSVIAKIIIDNGVNLESPVLPNEKLTEAKRSVAALYQRSDIQKQSGLREKVKGIYGVLVDKWASYRSDLSKLREAIEQFLKTDVEPDNPLSKRHWNKLCKSLPHIVESIRIVESILSWRLLSIRTDGLSYLLSAPSIPDLFARRNMLQDGWNRVRRLLEETYPLGLEVYRDENGPVFVVPDIEHLDTALVDSATHKTLGQHILEKFAEGSIENDPRLAIKGEIVPEVYVDSEPWKGQPTPQELPPIGKNWKRSGEKGHLERETHLIADPRFVADAWRRHHGEICTVCGLRPQGPSLKAKRRNVCKVCEQRRADRAKEWATEKLYTTIWVDEVADVNGRLALLVGTFDLTHWLSGIFVRTLAVRDPKDASTKTADVLAKNPSFARLHRIWETTRRFWQEVAPTSEIEGDSKRYADQLRKSVLGRCTPQIGPRLEIRGQLRPRHVENLLGPYHSYEIVLPQGVKVSALWDPENERFITLENLLYIAKLIDENVHTWEDALGTVKSAICGTLTIEEPTGYGAASKVWGEITVEEGGASEIDGGYFPVIPILAEPRIFMALVPADKALKVVEEIKAKYEREMGKVRNRLPLHLGIVFVHRRTPIRALLDAGRQMLRQTRDAAGWQVKDVRKQPDKGGALPKRFRIDQNGQFARWYEVVLEKNGYQITWYVPAMMGDSRTEDLWYPYVFLETDDEPVDRSRRFLAPNPETERDGWLVHVSELKSGDRVYFTPSTLDYEFLDVTSRRFKIHYDENGRRVTRPTRPYYLEDLERLNTLWHHLLHLSKTQRHQVISTVETTREIWFGQDEGKRSWWDDVFKRFVADTLAGASWPKSHLWRDIPQEKRTALIEAGVRGELADLVELHMEILKEV